MLLTFDGRIRMSHDGCCAGGEDDGASKFVRELIGEATGVVDDGAIGTDVGLSSCDAALPSRAM